MVLSKEKVLLKKMGISQYKDGVRINKEFHDIFNPPDNIDYCSRGCKRDVSVRLNNKLYKANYRYEGTKVSKAELHRIGFSKALANEFRRLFPTPNGYFSIELYDNDINQFRFNIVSDEALEIQDILNAEVDKSVGDSSKARKHRLASSSRQPGIAIVSTIVFIRNYDVIAEVLCRANGFCERCGKEAPFKRKSNGNPYLEVHHCKPLSQGGDDSVENAIGLCPNCHREMHYGESGLI